MRELRTLFLVPPARRPAQSLPLSLPGTGWGRHPVCLAEAASLVPNSKLLDARAEGLSVEEVLQRARGFELCLLHSTLLSVPDDLRAVSALKSAQPSARVGLFGAGAALRASEALREGGADFLLREPTGAGLLELTRGRPWEEVPGLLWREGSSLREGASAGARGRPPSMDLMAVYRRDLAPGLYAAGGLPRPFLTLRTRRGCLARCAAPEPLPWDPGLLLSPSEFLAEAKLALSLFPDTRELFVEDEDFAADPARAEAIAAGLQALGVSWSCAARPEVQARTLSLLKAGGLRSLVVDLGPARRRGEGGLRRGWDLAAARRFGEDCRRLELRVRGAFLLGLPGETREALDDSADLAERLFLHSVELLRSPERPDHETLAAARRFLLRFYLRPATLWRALRDLLREPRQLRRRLSQGVALLRLREPEPALP